MNRTVLVGRLTKDPDLRYTSNGTATASFTVAVNRNFKNASGEREADFINCVAWRKAAETLSNFVKKGSQIAVDGRLQTRSYDNQQGQRVFVTELVVENFTFLDSKKEDGNQSSYKQKESYSQPKGNKDPFERGNGKPIDISDDDLPF